MGVNALGGLSPFPLKDKINHVFNNYGVSMPSAGFLHFHSWDDLELLHKECVSMPSAGFLHFHLVEKRHKIALRKVSMPSAGFLHFHIMERYPEIEEKAQGVNALGGLSPFPQW